VRLSKDQIEKLETASSLVEALEMISDLFPGKVVFSSSLGQEDQVITDAIFKNDLPIKIFTLDTGRLFSESYELIERTTARYKKPIRVYFPEASDVEEFVTTKGVNSFYESVENRKECCNIRKVKPLNRALQGADVWNADWRTRQGVGNGLVAEEEDNGKIPRGYIAGVYNIEQWRVDDGSFVKLREVSLGYDFGRIKNIFTGLTLRISGRNLVSWDHYKGFDPEVNGPGQSTILRGIDFGYVPIPATYNFGITATF